MDVDKFFLQFNLLSLLLLFIVTAIHFRYNVQGSLTRRLTTFFLFSVFYATLVPYLIQSGFIIHVPHFYRTGTIAGLLASPLMFLITVSAMRRRKLNWRDLFHLAPVIFYVVNFSPLFLLGAADKVALIRDQSVSAALYSYAEGWLVNGAVMGDIRMLQILFYLVLTLRQVILYKHELDQWKEVDFNWRPVILQLMLFVLLYLMPFMVSISAWFDMPLRDTNQVAFAMDNMLLAGFFLSNPELLYGFRVIAQKPQPLTGQAEIHDHRVPVVIESAIPEPAGDQASERVQRRIERISSHLEGTKTFLSPEFSLTTLEKEIGISGKLISQTIKEGTGQNFSAYINDLRISYVVEQLKSDPRWKNYTVETLAGAAGYRSPTSFYNNFKDKTGKTPREFIELLG